VYSSSGHFNFPCFLVHRTVCLVLDLTSVYNVYLSTYLAYLKHSDAGGSNAAGGGGGVGSEIGREMTEGGGVGGSKTAHQRGGNGRQGGGARLKGGDEAGVEGAAATRTDLPDTSWAPEMDFNNQKTPAPPHTRSRPGSVTVSPQPPAGLGKGGRTHTQHTHTTNMYPHPPHSHSNGATGGGRGGVTSWQSHDLTNTHDTRQGAVEGQQSGMYLQISPAYLQKDPMNARGIRQGAMERQRLQQLQPHELSQQLEDHDLLQQMHQLQRSPEVGERLAATPSHSRCVSPTHCNTLQHSCNILQHTATHCSILQHTATLSVSLSTAMHCNALHHAAPHCTTLQHTATYCDILRHTTTHCNILQHTATHCSSFCRRKAESGLPQPLRTLDVSAFYMCAGLLCIHVSLLCIRVGLFYTYAQVFLVSVT